MWEELSLAVTLCGPVLVVLLGAVYGQERRLRFYRDLAALGEKLTRLTGPTEFEAGFLRLLADYLGAEAGLLYTPAPGPVSLRLKATHGLAEPELLAAASDPWLRHLITEISARHEQEVAHLLKRRNGFILRYRAVLALRFPGEEDQPSGIAFFFRRRRPFRPHKIRVLRAVASQAALALMRARASREQTAVTAENVRLYVNLSRLRRVSTIDETTGLLNRRYLLQRLKEEIKKACRFGQPLAMIRVAVSFSWPGSGEIKPEELGGLLAETAGLLKQAVRDYDIVGRYGPEEFLLLLPQTTGEGALALAGRLRPLLEEHPFGGEVRSRVLLGLCAWEVGAAALPPERLRDRNFADRLMEEVLAKTQEALDRAKETTDGTALIILSSPRQ